MIKDFVEVFNEKRITSLIPSSVAEFYTTTQHPEKYVNALVERNIINRRVKWTKIMVYVWIVFNLEKAIYLRLVKVNLPKVFKMRAVQTFLYLLFK